MRSGPMIAGSIVASGLGFSFRERTVEDFSLSVRGGEAVAILGTNGAGKTTVMRILAGELRAARGTVRVMEGDPSSARIRRSIAVIRETTSLEPYLTVEEWLRLAIDVYGVPRERKAEIAAMLDRYGVGGAARKRCGALSKGMARRVELAQLELVDPPVWLLDEPDSGLDPPGARLFRSAISGACERSRAVVFSSHSVLDATECATRLIVLRAGRIAFDGSTGDVIRRLDRRSFVAGGGSDRLSSALAAAAASEGATLTGPSVPLLDLEAFLFAEPAP